MSRVSRAAARSVLAAALLSCCPFALSGLHAGEAQPARDRRGTGDALRLDEIVIQGRLDDPGVVFLLPRAASPPIPLTAAPDERKEALLRDTREDDEAAAPDERR